MVFVNQELKQVIIYRHSFPEVAFAQSLAGIGIELLEKVNESEIVDTHVFN